VVVDCIVDLALALELVEEVVGVGRMAEEEVDIEIAAVALVVDIEIVAVASVVGKIVAADKIEVAYSQVDIESLVLVVGSLELACNHVDT